MRKFAGLKAKNYTFRDKDGERDLIALYAGPKPVAFIEYDTARKFVDRIHDLCDENEQTD